MTTPGLRTVSDGNVSLPSSLTGKWLMTLFRCCLVPIIIRYVSSGLSFSLLDSIHKISVRQSLQVEKQILVHLIVKVICKPVCHQHKGDDRDYD